MNKLITNTDNKVASIVDLIEQLNHDQRTLLAKELGDSAKKLEDAGIENVSQLLDKANNFTQRTIARFIVKIIMDQINKKTLTKKEAVASISKIIVKVCMLIASDLQVTVKSILVQLNELNKIELSKNESSNFKYWFIDQHEKIHRWKGIGLPPKGFHELILSENLEDFNVIKTPKPKSFNLVKKS